MGSLRDELRGKGLSNEKRERREAVQRRRREPALAVALARRLQAQQEAVLLIRTAAVRALALGLADADDGGLA